MERNLASLKFSMEGPVHSAAHSTSTCSACGEDFEQPLLAMVFSDSLVEEYYACPKCLSKVAGLHRKDVEVDEAEEEAEVEEPAALKFEAEVESPVGDVEGCMHHVGYLKSRPKNTPIPEECLTCSKMIDCMY
jgi:DNA-directed RNA polymerase subunit RPC12/RpoP